MTEHQPTLQHLALLAAKAETINAARIAAEEQLIHRLATDHAAGRATTTEVYTAFAAARGIGARGFAKRWDNRMPYALQSKRIAWTAVRYAADPDGNWRGSYPFTDETRTPNGETSVVYVLFDEQNRPCYVGSTRRFRTRMSSHSREGKRFTHWIAHPCPNRAAAYALEERLLAEHQPYLNRKSTR